MLDSLSLWLHETPLGETLLTMLISMLPVVELRGGLPAGVAMGLPIPVAFAASLVGNMIPVPFIILFVRPLFQWVRIHIPKLEGFISHLEARAGARQRDGDEDQKPPRLVAEHVGAFRLGARFEV